MKTDLSDSVVVVTGASGRLGRVVVAHLRAAGAAVAALDLVPPDDAGDGVLPVGADLADEGAVAEAFARVEAELGTPTALVHTVGMWAGAPLTATPLDAWERVLRVNLTSTFLCFREAARLMRRSGQGGRLVALASRQGADAAPAQQAGYAASKAGVVRLVEASAAEYAVDGIAAAAIAPSTILFGDEGEDARGVTAEVVASLCAYLCGPGGPVHSGTVLRAYGNG
ncbi:MAG TPA: SDR family NAD(P)-dependent oxidoreductase [Rhodothermales bacterium]|nr:SDR family NAD(P)-dependent oxidoreductase [Rhodothermales bacterium]